MTSLAVQHFLVVALALFIVGACGVVARREPLFLVIALEIMAASAVVMFLAFARWTLLPEGQTLAFLALLIGIAQAIIGAAAAMAIGKRSRSEAEGDPDA